MPTINCPVSDSSSLNKHRLLSHVELDFFLVSCRLLLCQPWCLQGPLQIQTRHHQQDQWVILWEAWVPPQVFTSFTKACRKGAIRGQYFRAYWSLVRRLGKDLGLILICSCLNSLKVNLLCGLGVALEYWEWQPGRHICWGKCSTTTSLLFQPNLLSVLFSFSNYLGVYLN